MSARDPIALFRSELRTAVERKARTTKRHRRLIVISAVVITSIAAGTALASNAWLTGEPAPPSVVADFGTHTPQLGSQPDANGAVLVAQDGNSSLYATTSSDGGYCIAASPPWRKLDANPDGGTCVDKTVASEPVAVGIVDSVATRGSDGTVLVGGRVNVRDAAHIGFSTPSGREITRPLRSSGFFLAEISASVCEDNWAPLFTVYSASGKLLTQDSFTLIHQIKGTSGGIACEVGTIGQD
jgi:hypothetical protein